MSSDLLRSLGELDTCSVSDALDRLELPGSVGGVRCLTGRRRIAGRAITVELGPPSSGPGSSSHLATAAIEAALAGDVVVVDHQGRTDCAAWGGKLSRAACFKRLAGTIVFGAARDIDESRAIEYPVFATAATPRTARGRAVEVGWGRPIRFAGVEVSPGDLVLADGSGVVFVPAALADSVLSVAKELAAAEARFSAAIESGVPVTEVMGAAYESMLSDSASRPPGGSSHP